MSFGSEASAQLGSSHDFGAGLSLSVEGLVHPALAQDESTTEGRGAIRLRRVPAELLVSGQLAGKNERLVLGAGTSLPLSERVGGNGRETFAGPPGAPFFLTLRVEHVF